MVRWRDRCWRCRTRAWRISSVGGKVLGPMVKRIAPDVEAVSVVTMDDIEGLLAKL